MSIATEQQCCDTIIEAATALGYMVHHDRPGRTASGWRTAIQGHAGFPDLLIAGHGRVFAVELKRGKNKPTDSQTRWLEELARGGVPSDVVYVPDGQDSLIRRLQDAAVRRP